MSEYFENVAKNVKIEDRFIVGKSAADWECEMFGMGKSGIVVRPLKGDVPNAFHRFMQRLFFGNKWVRVRKGDGMRQPPEGG